MTASELLRQAKALIADERNWWDGQGVRLSRGRMCAVDAIDSAAHPRGETRVKWKAEVALRNAAGGQITAYNDTHTHPEVMAAFDRAIELAERQEAA